MPSPATPEQPDIIENSLVSRLTRSEREMRRAFQQRIIEWRAAVPETRNHPLESTFRASVVLSRSSNLGDLEHDAQHILQPISQPHLVTTPAFIPPPRSQSNDSSVIGPGSNEPAPPKHTDAPPALPPSHNGETIDLCTTIISISSDSELAVIPESHAEIEEIPETPPPAPAPPHHYSTLPPEFCPGPHPPSHRRLLNSAVATAPLRHS